MLNWTFARRPGPGGPAATGITVARPGHNCDCAQAPVRLVACAAGVVTCSRLVVCKLEIWPQARGSVPLWLLATHAYPASDGWHGQFKLTATRAVARLITAMTHDPWRILQATSLLHVTTPAALHATSRTGACAQSQSCPGRATVMPVAAPRRGRRGLAFSQRFNLTCYITI